MVSLRDRIGQFFGDRRPAAPMTQQSVPGFAIYGGYISTGETNAELRGGQRWVTAADILANISIVAASARFSLNLISRPSWKFDPVNDTAEAKAAAEFMDSVVDGIDTSWTRIVRRAGLYRYHGFGIHEWVAKKRDDGKIGIRSLHSVPQHTVTRWDYETDLRGIVQNDPQSGQELYLPRRKMLYLVDDTLTDKPDGMGWFRHLVDPANRLKSFLELEAIGFERDLTGIPVGRAPLASMNAAVKAGQLAESDKKAMIDGMREMIKIKRKSRETGLILDSEVYPSKTDNGTTPSSTPLWDLDLLDGTQNSIEDLGAAIKRTAFDMALIMGTSSLLVGREGEGSRALSEDQSRNMYLTANSTLADMAEAVDRDLVDPLWAMNGLPDELKPKANPEDVSFKDVTQIAQVLSDMANAGAILAPDDPAINDIRDLMGLPHAPEMDLGMLNALQGRSDPTKPSPDAELNDERSREQMANDNEREKQEQRAGGGAPPKGKSPGQTARKAYNPKQPRAPQGSEIGGRWVDSGWLGKSVNLDDVKTEKIDDGTWTIKSGEDEIGRITLLRDWEKNTVHPAVSLSSVHYSDLRGYGIANRAYDQIERDIGQKLIPSPLGISEPATQLWQSRLGKMDSGVASGLLDQSKRLGLTYGISEAHIDERLAPLRASIVKRYNGARKARTDTLYVSRNLKNPDDLIAWAKSVGFAKTVPADEMHVTVAFSREAVDWTAAGDSFDTVRAGTGKRKVAKLGENGDAVVLMFESAELADRWQEFTDAGASWDWPSYQPHVTITYDGAAIDIDDIPPYDGVLDFGPEKFAPVNEDWKATITEKALFAELYGDVGKLLETAKRYNPDQPRDPAGTATGGRWTDGTPGYGADDHGVHHLDKETKRQLVADLKDRSLDELLEDAAENQKTLGVIGDKLAKDTGLEFINPGAKSRARVLEKVAGPEYDGPHQITDLARATFVVDQAGDAEAAIRALSKQAAVYDKGWTKLKESGYLDRKVFVRFDNGGLAEVQLVPRGIQQLKAGRGHKLYEIARAPSTPRHVAEAAMEESRQLYAGALQGTEFAQLGD